MPDYFLAGTQTYAMPLNCHAPSAGFVFLIEGIAMARAMRRPTRGTMRKAAIAKGDGGGEIDCAVSSSPGGELPPLQWCASAPGTMANATRIPRIGAQRNEDI